MNRLWLTFFRGVFGWCYSRRLGWMLCLLYYLVMVPDECSRIKPLTQRKGRYYAGFA